MTGEAISMTGTWMQTFAQGWVLTSLTSSAMALGAINFAAGLPILVLSMLGGSFADRYDKRLILHAALGIQVVTALSIGWLIGSDQIAIWHIFVAAALLGVTHAFEVPTVAAFVPELVEKAQMASAIAIDRSVFHATRLIGPAVGGLLLANLGASSVYYLNALSYLALIIAVLTIPARPPGDSAERKLRESGIGEGLAFVRSDPPTRVMVLLMVAITAFASPFLMVTMPLYARTTLGLSAQSMGLLMAITGVGSFIGSLMLLSIPRRSRTLALRCGAGCATTALVGLSWAPGFAAAACFFVLLTLGLSTAFGLANIIIQERAPDAIRGRVSAVAGLAFFGVLPFSGLLISFLADALGMRGSLYAAAVCYACCATVLLFRPCLSGPAPNVVPEEATADS
jgi:MFS family permease